MKYYLIKDSKFYINNENDLVYSNENEGTEDIISLENNYVELTEEELVDIGIMTILGRKNNSKLREKIRKVLE